jgi:hypothetical protein
VTSPQVIVYNIKNFAKVKFLLQAKLNYDKMKSKSTRNVNFQNYHISNEMTKITNSNNQRMGVHGPLNIYQRWDQVPWRSEHPLLTSHNRHEPHFKHQ